MCSFWEFFMYFFFEQQSILYNHQKVPKRFQVQTDAIKTQTKMHSNKKRSHQVNNHRILPIDHYRSVQTRDQLLQHEMQGTTTN